MLFAVVSKVCGELEYPREGQSSSMAIQLDRYQRTPNCVLISTTCSRAAHRAFNARRVTYFNIYIGLLLPIRRCVQIA